MNDEDSGRMRPVLYGLGALLAVSILVGATISVVALGLADVAGVAGGDATAKTSSAEPTMFVPEPSATEKSSAPPTATTSEPSTSPTEPSEPASTKQEPARRAITLSASPLQVSSMGRIDLTGRYPGGDGSTLQVQRLEGVWADFPVDASVAGGTFSTYVQTGQTGSNRFRVVDKATGEVSNPVTITVG
ncbi:MAG: hypothetical protein M3393_02165 [Actinomycetota bacterium]|nr:hypothetical protein [Actinomycetota bacterium]